MATKKPAKIASAKKGKAAAKACPVCGTDMAMAKVLRVEAASGMYWLCTSNTCNSLMTTAGARAGALEI